MMAWTRSPDFELRTALHLQRGLGEALKSAQPFIVTHATRGDVAGRTTHVLSPLRRKHGLVEVTLLLPADAPHNAQGYAVERSAAKQEAVAELLAPYAADLLASLTTKRALVAGRFAQGVLSRLGADAKAAAERSYILYPCHWRNAPLQETHAKLSSILGVQTPSQEQLARYIIWAHRQSLRDRWARLSVEAKRAFCELRKLAYEALPPEEKARRSQEARLAYEALPPEEKARRSQEARLAYEALPPEEKARRSQEARLLTRVHWKKSTAVERLLRTQACISHRRTPAGRAAWRQALREAKSRMAPEKKAAVMAALRAGYCSKMTAEAQARVGFKRRQAWTAEKRQAASLRMKSQHSAAAVQVNLLKAQAALRNPEVLKKRDDKRLTTTALKVERLILETMARLQADPDLELSTKERRTLRDSCRKSLAAHSEGRLSVNAKCVETLQAGERLSLEAGAASKSAGLKRRWEAFRQA